MGSPACGHCATDCRPRVRAGTPAPDLSHHVGVSGALERGRAAFARDDWFDTYTALTSADRESTLLAPDLHRLGVSAYMIGKERESVDAHVRAHEAFLAGGEVTAAARSAFWVAFSLIDKPGQQAQAGGWLSRMRRLIDGRGPCAEEGLLLCALGFRKSVEGDVDGSCAACRQALEIGERFRDPDVIALARHSLGRALVRLGRTADGLSLLDEAMLDLTRGATTPMITGLVYCSLISACHELFDWRRAHEWTAVLDGWCTTHPDMVPFRGTCLVRRSELLQWHGQWPAAMDDVRRACEYLPGNRPDAGAAFYQLADLHRLRGDVSGAEDAYRRASQAGRRPDPGWALLRLDTGDTDAACAAIRRALQEARDRRQRSHLLRAAVDILLEAHDPAGAAAAAGELTQLATTMDAPFLRAASAQASGTVALAAGNLDDALAHLRDAWQEWQRLEVPYELARVRVLVGLAYRQMGDRDGAQLEFDAAHEAFDRLGAAPDAARVAALAANVATGRPAAGGLTGREVEVLRLVATGRTNRAIASELDISEKTVARHLANIFTKLDLASRAAATAYAYEHKLV
jgi:DNA-binding CsgD family transcriptional regulator